MVFTKPITRAIRNCPILMCLKFKLLICNFLLVLEVLEEKKVKVVLFHVTCFVYIHDTLIHIHFDISMSIVCTDKLLNYRLKIFNEIN